MPSGRGLRSSQTPEPTAEGDRIASLSPSPATTSGIQAKYPEAFAEWTRDHVISLHQDNKLDYVTFKWTSPGEDGRPSASEYKLMKNVVAHEFKKHLITFLSNKGAFVAIRAALPNVKVSSNVCREIRQHIITKFSGWKIDMTRENVLSYVFDIIKAEKNSGLFDHDTDINDPDDRGPIEALFIRRFNAQVLCRILGAELCEAIDVKTLFSNSSMYSRAREYLKTIGATLCVWIVPVALAELKLNDKPTRSSRSSHNDGATTPSKKTAKWQVDKMGRSRFLQKVAGLPANEQFAGVELNMFPWRNYPNKADEAAARAAPGGGGGADSGYNMEVRAKQQKEKKRPSSSNSKGQGHLPATMSARRTRRSRSVMQSVEVKDENDGDKDEQTQQQSEIDEYDLSAELGASMDYLTEAMRKNSLRRHRH